MKQLGNNISTHDESDYSMHREAQSSYKLNMEKLARVFRESRNLVDQRLAKLYRVSQCRNIATMKTKNFGKKPAGSYDANLQDSLDEVGIDEVGMI